MLHNQAIFNILNNKSNETQTLNKLITNQTLNKNCKVNNLLSDTLFKYSRIFDSE